MRYYVLALAWAMLIAALLVASLVVGVVALVRRGKRR